MPLLETLAVLGAPLLVWAVLARRLLPVAHAEDLAVVPIGLDRPADEHGRRLEREPETDRDDGEAASLSIELRLSGSRRRGKKGRVWVTWKETLRRIEARSFWLRVPVGDGRSKRVRVVPDERTCFAEMPEVEVTGAYSLGPRVRCTRIEAGEEIYVAGWYRGGGSAYRDGEQGIAAAPEVPLVVYRRSPVDARREAANAARARLLSATVALAVAHLVAFGDHDFELLLDHHMVGVHGKSLLLFAAVAAVVVGVTRAPSGRAWGLGPPLVEVEKEHASRWTAEPRPF